MEQPATAMRRAGGCPRPRSAQDLVERLGRDVRAEPTRASRHASRIGDDLAVEVPAGEPGEGDRVLPPTGYRPVVGRALVEQPQRRPGSSHPGCARAGHPAASRVGCVLPCGHCARVVWGCRRRSGLLRSSASLPPLRAVGEATHPRAVGRPACRARRHTGPPSSVSPQLATSERRTYWRMPPCGSSRPRPACRCGPRRRTHWVAPSSGRHDVDGPRRASLVELGDPRDRELLGAVQPQRVGVLPCGNWSGMTPMPMRLLRWIRS